MKDLFSSHSNDYAKYRPAYPSKMYEYIYSFVSCFNLAWDCGTGNGQAAFELSKQFKTIYATDVSEQQLLKASQTNNIVYAKEPAENTTLVNNSVDLITVAQALHWLDFSAFYKEVKRVAKSDALLAVWTYNLLSVDDQTDAYIHDLYFQTLNGYWDAERKYVDTGYANLPFPYSEIDSPQFYIEAKWSLNDLIGYLNTWSGMRKFILKNKVNPTDQLFVDLQETWQPEEAKTIRFPVFLKLGKVSTFQENCLLF